MMNRTLILAVSTCSALGLMSLVAPAVIVAQAADVANVQVSKHAEYGEFLVDAKGMSLYMFDADSKDASSCYEACAQAWPPLLTAGAPMAGKSVAAGMLSTIQRKDGSTQVTYNGRPLYYFFKDKAAGDTKGQDIEGFGAEWYLVSPEGEEVED